MGAPRRGPAPRPRGTAARDRAQRHADVCACLSDGRGGRKLCGTAGNGVHDVGRGSAASPRSLPDPVRTTRALEAPSPLHDDVGGNTARDRVVDRH